MTRRAAPALAALALAAAVAGLTADLGPGPIRLDVGAYQGPLRGVWSAPLRAAFPEGVHGSLVADGVIAFYYRLLTERGELPSALRTDAGTVTLTLRAESDVRSILHLFAGGRPAGELVIPAGPWRQFRTPLEVPAGRDLTLGLALRPAPLVRGDHAERVVLGVDYAELESETGFSLAPRTRLTLAAIPLLLFAGGLLAGGGARWALAAAAAGATAAVALAQLAPIPVSLAAPRLLPAALLAGLSVRAVLGTVGDLGRGERNALAALVFAGVLAHGSLPFFPNHNPPDLDTHAVRALDLERTTLSYHGLLRYGSHLPTPSQEAAPATDLFGERALVPYSPLPYFVYYALHRAGLDVAWAMTVATSAALMAVAPLVWLVARQLWGRPAAWTGVLLYCLDLPIWHHLGRAHLPASLGNALGVAALLALVWQGSRVDSPRRVLAAAVVLALGVLGYTSLALFIGLFGLILFAALAVDARALSRRARRGLVGAFVLGGLIAGALYYFHYVPGLLGQAGSLEAQAPDLFDPRTFAVFHNESRQSMRIWRLGSWWLFGAGLVAAPWALWRAPATARPLLAVWLATWGVFMVLKEPFLFPKLLRWSKEEQVISPLMGLFAAGALGTLPRPWMRWTLGIVAVGWAFRLALRDFLLHANSLAL